jgi:hypothetical protein
LPWRRAVLLAALLAVVVASLLLAGSWVGRAARPWIEEQAGEALGRAVRIRGPVRPLVSLYPGLHLGDVRVENPPGSSEPLFLEVAQLEARLDLPALLRRELRVRGVRLFNGRVVIGAAAPASGAETALDPGVQLALLRSLAGDRRFRNLVFEIVLEDGTRRRIELKRAHLRDCGEPVEATVRLGATSIELEGKLVCRPDGLALQPVAARVGESDLRGRVALRFAREALSIEADFEAGELLASDVLDAVSAPPDAEVASELDALLPFDAVEDVDLDLKLRAEVLYANAGVARELEAQLRSEPGGLRVSLTRGSIAEGAIAGELRVDLAQEPPRLELKLSLGDASLATLAPDAFFEGALGLDLDMHGSGDTLRKLLAGANGRTHLTVSEALLTEDALGALGRDLFSLLPSDDREEADRRVHCAVLHAGFEAGRGAVLTVVDTPDASLAGRGSLDLGSLSGDLLLKPRPRRASLGAVKLPIRISGPLDALRVGVDKRELASALGKALGLSLLNPLGVLVDPGVRGNPCEEAIDRALGEVPADGSPTPTSEAAD